MNGVNYWPHDIESTVENSHKILRKGCVAAFSVITEKVTESLFIVAEIRKDAKVSTSIIKEIKQTVQKQVFQNNSLSIATGFYRILRIF
jgi:acyl-CoA synthetase (AMP-forming)/AMP-acid ligase II